jgi:hypothetical protein
MNPKDIMRLSQEEAYEALQTTVPSMRCELPVIGSIQSLGYRGPDAHVHIFDIANNEECCMTIPVRMAQAIGQEDDEDLRMRAKEYLESIMVAEWN